MRAKARIIVSEWKSIGIMIDRRWICHGTQKEQGTTNQNQRARKETIVAGQRQTPKGTSLSVTQTLSSMFGCESELKYA